MKLGTKEYIGIFAILVIVFMTFQGTREDDIVIIDRAPEYISTPVFVGGPRMPPRFHPRRRRHHGHHGHHGPPKPPKPLPPKPPKPPKPPIKIPKIPIKPPKP